MAALAIGRCGAVPETAVDAVVVGAGPVGLLAAGELRLGGVQAVVLDRLPAPHRESRAAQLGPRSVELLLQRGMARELGTPPRRDRGHFGGAPLEMGLAGGPIAANWMVPQFRTEEILRAWLSRLGVPVYRGHEVVGLCDDGEEVVLEIAAPHAAPGRVRRLRTRYVLGCDGRDGAVRHLGGIDAQTRPARRELLRADIVGAELAARRFDRLPDGVAAAGALPGGVTRIMVHRYGAAPAVRTRPPCFDEVAAAWKQVTGEDIGACRALWTDSFTDARHHAAAYRCGRVLIAGDAARSHMPVAGQSLNTGLLDAVNLGWKLAAQIKGWAPDGLLDTYHSERHAAGARVLANVEAQTVLQFDGERAEPLRGLVGELMAVPAAARHLAELVGGVDVRYPARERGPGAGIMGLRIAPVRSAADPEPFPAGNGVLAVRPGVPCRTAPAEGWSDRVRTVPVRGAPDTDRLPSGVGAALLRPDGHVVWTDTSGSPIEDALRRWFGAPRTDHRDPKPTKKGDRT